jgi:hypothetical protein
LKLILVHPTKVYFPEDSESEKKGHILYMLESIFEPQSTQNSDEPLFFVRSLWDRIKSTILL